MALKSSTGQYIKLDLSGTYIIYESQSAREAEKIAPSPTLIIAQYQKILESFKQDPERLYYDPKFNEEFNNWREEYNLYMHCYSYAYDSSSLNFSLMQLYFPDIKNSIPVRFYGGKVKVFGNTLAEVYDYVKQIKLFGDTEDC